jgi:quercetin dioxygenase-like cupin family protein
MRQGSMALAVVVAVALCAASLAVAQAQGIKRTVLQRSDIAGTEPHECVLATAELEPGASVGKHFHHGVEVAYVAQGEIELLVDGEAPRRFKVGDSYRVPARQPHDGKNVGATPAKVVATYVIEKGKPLAEPVK